jgi:hypothetical protein
LSFFLVRSRSPSTPFYPKVLWAKNMLLTPLLYSSNVSPHTHIWVYQGAWEPVTRTYVQTCVSRLVVNYVIWVHKRHHSLLHVEFEWNLAFVTTLWSPRTPRIIYRNCIYIKSIVIFSFMKLANNVLIIITCFFVYCAFVNNILVPWPFHKYFSIMQFPPIFVVLKIKLFFWSLDILNIGCTKDCEMHLFIFLSWSPHMKLHSKTLFIKPLKSINICWFQ